MYLKITASSSPNAEVKWEGMVEPMTLDDIYQLFDLDKSLPSIHVGNVVMVEGFAFRFEANKWIRLRRLEVV